MQIVVIMDSGTPLELKLDPKESLKGSIIKNIGDEKAKRLIHEGIESWGDLAKLEDKGEKIKELAAKIEGLTIKTLTQAASAAREAIDVWASTTEGTSRELFGEILDESVDESLEEYQMIVSSQLEFRELLNSQRNQTRRINNAKKMAELASFRTGVEHELPTPPIGHDAVNQDIVFFNRRDGSQSTARIVMFYEGTISKFQFRLNNRQNLHTDQLNSNNTWWMSAWGPCPENYFDKDDIDMYVVAKRKHGTITPTQSPITKVIHTPTRSAGAKSREESNDHTNIASSSIDESDSNEVAVVASRLLEVATRVQEIREDMLLRFCPDGNPIFPKVFLEAKGDKPMGIKKSHILDFLASMDNNKAAEDEDENVEVLEEECEEGGQAGEVIIPEGDESEESDGDEEIMQLIDLVS